MKQDPLVLTSNWTPYFRNLNNESTLKSQDMSRTKAQPLPSLVGEGQGWGL